MTKIDRKMKSTINFLGLLLMSTLFMTSCNKDEVVTTNSNFEGTYKGQFMINSTTETETVIFKNNGVFNISLKSANAISTIKGWYTYDTVTKLGVIHYDNNISEEFICTDGELHIGNNIYCNHAEHKNGHSNNHLAESHHKKHQKNHNSNHNENHNHNSSHKKHHRGHHH